MVEVSWQLNMHTSGETPSHMVDASVMYAVTYVDLPNYLFGLTIYVQTYNSLYKDILRIYGMW